MCHVTSEGITQFLVSRNLKLWMCRRNHKSVCDNVEKGRAFQRSASGSIPLGLVLDITSRIKLI